MVIGPKHPNERALLKLEWICYWFLKYPSPPPTSHPVGRCRIESSGGGSKMGDHREYRLYIGRIDLRIALRLRLLLGCCCCSSSSPFDVFDKRRTRFFVQNRRRLYWFSSLLPRFVAVIIISPTTSVCSGAAMPFHWFPFESQAKPNHRKFPQLECYYYYYYYFGSPPTKQINTTTHSVCRKSLSRGDWRDECHHQIEIFSSKSQELSSTYESSVRSLVHVTRIGWLFCQPSAFSSEVAPEVHNCRQSNKSPPVFVSFRPQNVSRPLNDLVLLGQCHKITISKVACTLLSSLHPWPHSSLYLYPRTHRIR